MVYLLNGYGLCVFQGIENDYMSYLALGRTIPRPNRLGKPCLVENLNS
jgi:hypothetical protein